jgi:hypothetical protein
MASACLVVLGMGCSTDVGQPGGYSRVQSALTNTAVSAPAPLMPIGASSTPTTFPTRGSGPVLASAKLYAIYWGDFTSTQISTNQSYLGSLAAYLSGAGVPPNQEPTVAQYGALAAAVVGSFTDSTLPMSSIGQTDVISHIESLQSSNQIPAADPNTLFMVFTHGITFNDGYGAGGSSGYCAYHNNSGDLIFSLDPYPEATGTAFTCGLGGWNGLTEGAIWQAQTSHELQEAVTDPKPFTGWSPEIGDQCNWGNDPSNVTAMSFGAVQQVVDNVQGSCSNFTAQTWPSTQRIKGDFNGDGIEDIIIVNASGSYEYTGLASGGFTPNVWVRNDLTVGNTTYIPGDFNGDGITDIIIMNASGSYEYTGLASGGFTPNVWVRNDLTIGNTSYIPGDFNGDRVTDVIIVNSSGSYEYTGLASGGFTPNVWVRNDLIIGDTSYTPGDFNGDGIEDIMIMNNSGSYEYTGLASGGFTPNVWVRNDLTLGNTSYTTGDFNGDGATDLIIMNSSGSYEYTGLAGGGFTWNVWVRNDLTLGSTSYTTGDFNGDGITDLIIVNSSGSYEYTGLAGGGFTWNVWVRNDLTLTVASYFRGDFNGDGIADLIILTAGGSYEYTGLGGGGFTPNVWVRGDLPLQSVAYF